MFKVFSGTELVVRVVDGMRTASCFAYPNDEGTCFREVPLYFWSRVIYYLSVAPSSLLWTLRVGATSYESLAIVQDGLGRTIRSVPDLESCLRSGEHQGRLRQDTERALQVGITLWEQHQGQSKLDVTTQSRQHASRDLLSAMSSMLFRPRSVPIFSPKGPQTVFSPTERQGAGCWHLSPAVMSPEKWELVFDSQATFSLRTSQLLSITERGARLKITGSWACQVQQGASRHGGSLKLASEILEAQLWCGCQGALQVALFLVFLRAAFACSRRL